MLHSCILSREEEIEALAPAWSDLHARLALSPFTDFDFAMLWWRQIGKPSGAELRVAVCFEGERLVGVIPFSVRTKKGFRVLRLLGNEIYYYLNFLCENAAVSESLWQAVLADRSYDFANIKNIHDNTPDKAFWDARFPVFRASMARFSCHEGRSAEALRAALPKTLRRCVRRIEDGFAPKGDLEFAMADDKNVLEVPSVVAFLVERKRCWAQEKGRRGVFSEEGHVAFFESAITQSLARGRCFLCWLKQKGEIVAASLSFIEKRVIYAHTVTFSPQAAKISPGNYLTLRELAFAAENGFAETNFMEGQDAYLTPFSSGVRVSNEYVYPRTIKGYLYAILYKTYGVLIRMKAKKEKHG